MNNNYELISDSEITESYKYYIVFNIKDKRYAINIKNVVEIINLPDIEISKNMPQNIIGIFDYNGLMIKAVDLTSLLGETPESFSVDDKLIVLISEGDFFAIHTKFVENIISFDSKFIQPVPYSLENSLVNSIFKSDSEFINIIDIANLNKIISEENAKISDFDYSALFPADDKSKKILSLRTQKNKLPNSGFAFPMNFNINNQYILFTLDDFNYYLDLKYVKEFVSLKRLNITKLPYTQDYIRGIINIRGDFLVVVDLKKFFNKDTNSDSNKLIIAESKDFNIAFIVDDIKYIKTLKNIQKTYSDKPISPYIYAEFTENNKISSIINFEKIINDEKLYINIS